MASRRLTCSSSSFFTDLSTRELHGLKNTRPYNLGDLSSDLGGRSNGVLTIDHEGSAVPPLSLSFCKNIESSHLLAVSDEEGYVSLYNTHRNLPSCTSFREKSDQAKIFDWVAHNNAIFDLSWIKNGTQILTASGDQTVKLWNVENRKCLGILSGHTGSVKSLSYHSSNPELLVSGSRDGSFALWDLRCNSNSNSKLSNKSSDKLIASAFVKDAHTSTQAKRTRRGKVAPASITSVLYLKDEISIASAGAADSVVKLWDTRKLKSPFSQSSPHGEPQSDKEMAKHGISCLSQDSSGSYITASCMDNKIYLYNTFHFDKGPAKIFSGSKIESFFVKSSISPEGTHILSGSSDGNAYIWRVDKPERAPLTLKGHEGEVTAVDWCISEVGKISTSADDFTVRVWNNQKRNETSIVSPTVVRKRITAPNLHARRLAFNDEPCPNKESNLISSIEKSQEKENEKEKEINYSPDGKKSDDLRTPESGKKRPFDLESPSSVLNPPSSLKRKTIRDYFASAT
ncbi:hypothetical protein LUZ60_006379 [Juncus effusus]|nr:hypothetical protein LUZ60_006379 [Juncus effusus]